MPIDELLPGDDGDRQLIRRMAAGDLTAHRLLYERHAADLLRYLLGRMGAESAAAEDLLQEVMLLVWQQAAGFRGASRVRTWLFGIAHHRAAKMYRRQRTEWRHRGQALDDEAHPVLPVIDHRLGQTDQRIDLDRALSTLAWEQRAVLDLCFYHGMTEAEMAEVLAVAPGTVKSRLHRAKTALRAELAADREDSRHA